MASWRFCAGTSSRMDRAARWTSREAAATPQGDALLPHELVAADSVVACEHVEPVQARQGEAQPLDMLPHHLGKIALRQHDPGNISRHVARPLLVGRHGVRVTAGTRGRHRPATYQRWSGNTRPVDAGPCTGRRRDRGQQACRGASLCTPDLEANERPVGRQPWATCLDRRFGRIREVSPSF